MTGAGEGIWAGCPYCRRYVRLRHVMVAEPVTATAADGSTACAGTVQVASPALIGDAMALHVRACAQ